MATRTWSRWLRPLSILFTLALGCAPPSPSEQRLPVVTVSLPVEKSITDHFDFTGKTQAVESVQVRARVGGYLDKVLFKEGDLVKKGQILFQIDPRPYQAELDQAGAQVKAQSAQAGQAETEYQRTRRLFASGGANTEDVDNAERTRDVTMAAVEAARATVRVKELNLGFTKVLSPIDGRVDKADITVGNLVTANLGDATVLTSIVSVAPMYVYFDVDELTMLQIQKMVRDGKVQDRGKKEPEVMLGLGNGNDYPIRGKIDFVGNQVNPSTGTISVRGVFPNADGVLSPGLFARIRVPLGEPHSGLLINDRALGTNQGQKFLLVVNDKDEVVYRPVTVGALHGELREIVAGLRPTERVIINGLLRVRPGITVKPKMEEKKNG